MMRRWLMALFRWQPAPDPSIPSPEEHELQMRQSEQVRRMSDELYHRLAMRDVQHREALARARLWPETMTQAWKESARGKGAWYGDLSDQD